MRKERESEFTSCHLSRPYLFPEIFFFWEVNWTRDGKVVSRIVFTYFPNKKKVEGFFKRRRKKKKENTPLGENSAWNLTFIFSRWSLPYILYPGNLFGFAKIWIIREVWDGNIKGWRNFFKGRFLRMAWMNFKNVFDIWEKGFSSSLKVSSFYLLKA